ncbi:ABC transporter ATP-binding protein [Paracoccus saliphilus]|uniref:ABC transport system ATP-binding protein n=1 Tax=Paracoccus saliphilus TaxID=405559 RepID=A0AA45W7X0_9RHOB|nr:ATP-binding cassette domain-containing protein [Paracoccus saliphilus]WCR04808.1 ATP-binding cassette domain-containing protein [Paracoccus saliphilus]SIT12859.1 putative ABC transport system ATP-binding protein [Paracoccus saliphilus]
MTLGLSISGLRVSAPSGRILLDVEALDFAPGTCIGLRGPSGAGKSTFLLTIAGLIEAMSGRVTWGDDDLLAMSAPARARFRRQRMGLIFQDFLLFEELSAAANAALPGAYASRTRQRGIRGRADVLLQKLGITHGARTVDSFSGGERQRVAVARALAGDPAIILADEPTASLDRTAADRLTDDLLGLVREEGKTLIAVSHDPALHACMDRVIDIVDGRISQDRAAA